MLIWSCCWAFTEHPPSISIKPRFFSRDLSFQLPLPALGGRVLSVSIPKLGRFLCRIVGLSQTKTDCSNKKKLHHPHRWPPKLFAKLFVYDAEVNAKYVLRSAVPRGENWVQIPLGRSPGLDILRSSSKPVHWCNFLLGTNWKREKKEQKACHSHLVLPASVPVTTFTARARWSLISLSHAFLQLPCCKMNFCDYPMTADICNGIIFQISTSGAH